MDKLNGIEDSSDNFEDGKGINFGIVVFHKLF
jgi:hypothetical protein